MSCANGCTQTKEMAEAEEQSISWRAHGTHLQHPVARLFAVELFKHAPEPTLLHLELELLDDALLELVPLGCEQALDGFALFR